MKDESANFFASVRRWQVKFEVIRPLSGLLAPDVVVEEVRQDPGYVQDGRCRSQASGGQIVITLAGRGGFRVNGETFSLTPGRAFLHRHNDPSVTYFYPPDAAAEWRFLWIAFEGDSVPGLIDDLVSRYGYLYDVGLDSPLVEKLLSFKCEGRQIRFLTPLEGAGLALESLRLLCASAAARERETPHSRLAREVQTVIAAEFSTHLTAELLARRFGLSREHLSRIFAQETGMTLHDYLTRTRMRAAAELLRQTYLSAKEIAAQCGYAEYAVFYRTFVRHFHRSPAALRKRNGRNASEPQTGCP